MTEFARRPARVIVLDAADRLLLIRSAAEPDHPASGYAWFTPGGMLEYERRYYGGHHWWTQAELAATAEMIIPAGLVTLAADLIAGRLPATPVALPWSH